MTPGPALAAEPLFLVSFWKPFLLLVPFLAWAWVVSAIYDKDAQRLFFKRRQWNIVHLAMGALALAAGLLPPMIWIGLPAMLLVLGIDLGVYYYLRSKDDRAKHDPWSLSPGQWFAAKAAEKKKDKKAKTVSLVLKGPAGVIEPPEKESPEWGIRAAAESLIIAAQDARATRFDLAPIEGNRYGFSYLVDGVRQPGETMSAPEGVAIIDFFKRAAGLDVEDRRKKQQAFLTVERFNVRHKVRLSTQGAGGGMQLTGVFNPEKQVERRLDDVGLLPTQKAEIDKLVADPEGVALVAAPAGNGRTSAIYAILRAHDAYTTNVQTLELEVEAQIEGVRHNLFDPSVDGAEYSTTARSILRRDPDVLAVAETPDPLTVQEVVKADHTRTRVYLGLRADGVFQALQAYVKAAGDAEKAAKSLHGAVACKLLRRLCPNCKAAYQPTADILRKLGLPADKPVTLYRKGGQVLVKNKPETCPMCGGGGYVGQDGCFEVYTIDADERKMIAAGDLASLKASFRKRRLPSIQDAAVRKVIDGTTSIEEVVRITSPPAAPGARPAAKPAAPAPQKPAASQRSKPS